MPVHLPCYCATLRQAARVISQKYETAMRKAHLTITQFTLLTALEELPEARVNDLADALAMDQTTLSRTLKLMESAALIAQSKAADRRESRWVLTALGREHKRRAQPHWQAAQKEVETALGVRATKRLAASAFALGARLSAQEDEHADARA